MMVPVDRWWILDGGAADHHTVLRDKDGQWWGWENVRPRDLQGIQNALLRDETQWHHYAIRRPDDRAEPTKEKP